MTETIAKKDTQLNTVPEVDINAPLKVPIEKSTEYEPGVTSKNKRLFVLGTILLGVICFLTLSVIYFYFAQFKNKKDNKEPVYVQEEVVEVKTDFQKNTVSFEVLNASGISGAAKKAADEIEEMGYVIVKTGNSEEIEGNQLFLTSDIKIYSSEIISDLKDFNISSVAGSLEEGSSSARLILGIE